MGVLNVTPDSFSDGGKFNNPAAALAHATALIDAGATVIDVGGESTRPGAVRLSAAEEQARAIDIVAALATLPRVASGEVAISIDTLNASTAAAAVAAGASIVNDVSGGQADSQMFAVAAQTGATYVLGHWHNFEAGAGAVQETDDIVGEVVRELEQRIGLAESAGISRDKLVLDPGLGFGKSSEQNWQLADRTAELASLDLPLLIGASRKRFIAEKLATEAGVAPAEIGFDLRDRATADLGARVWLAMAEASQSQKLWGFRVHNVEASVAALQKVAAGRFAR
jgi:dihydropteroate synthase